MAIHDRYIFDNEASIPPGIAAAIQGVISNWDILPSDGWADFCTDDVEILLAGQHAQGFQATKTMRDSTFNVTNGPLVGVQHTLQDVYLKATSAAEGATTDVFFTGTVVYTVLGGKVSSVLHAESEASLLKTNTRCFQKTSPPSTPCKTSGQISTR